MLLQEAGQRILLLPAWPANWDAEFKLHLSNNTIVRGVVKDGLLKDWDIQPRSRMKDLVIYKPQQLSHSHK